MASEVIISHFEAFLKANPNLKRISIQLPDSLIPDAAEIFAVFQSSYPQLFFFAVTDTSFNDCCVDHISAQHLEADGIIHFGAYCNKKYSIPVCFVPSGSVFDSVSLSNLITSINEFVASGSERIYLVLDQVQNNLFEQLTSNLPEKVIISQESDQQEGIKMHGFYFPQLGKESISNSSVIYYGPHAKVATDLGSLFYLQPSLLLDSTTGNPFDLNITRDLAKRTAAVDSIRAFDQVGILVENPNIQLHIQLAQILQDLCFANGIFANILYVGRVNEMKIGNFPDLECFVHISCSGKGLFTFAKPIVSPFEFICAKFDVDFWEHQELRDLETLLSFCQVHQTEWIPEEARAANGQVVLKDLNQMTMMLSSIRQKYSYHGLQIDHANRDMTLHEGATGTAAGYDYELGQE